MSLETLLAVLADGKFHSGDELGGVLGVSRTAVWKQLKKVEELGLPLESVKGKGYCIEGGLDLLSAAVIQENIASDVSALISHIDVRGVIDSTSAVAMEKAVQGIKGYICTAEQQTAGRGRRGRVWASPYASNLYFSVVWEFGGGAASLEGLSLAVGVAVVDALEKSGLSGAELKWPNDVLYRGRKLAGVLLEMTGDPSGRCHVVIGIGLNVSMPASVSIDQPWIDVWSVSEAAANRNELLVAILNELMPLLSTFEGQGFSAYHDRWQALDAFAATEVAMTLGNDIVVGKAVGVDATGAIMIETPAGMRKFNGGEVSLRATG